VRVAVNQTRSLLEAGHDVTLVAGAQGYGNLLPTQYDGVPVKLFPAARLVPGTGFAGLVSPSLLRYVRSKADEVDVVHIHVARDLVTLPVARWSLKRKVPYVLQTHGMIDPSSNPLSVPLDAFCTKPVLAGAGAVLYLTPTERVGLSEVSSHSLSYVHLINGVPLQDLDSFGPSDHREVLFLARLHARKRPAAFINMARELAPTFPDVSFRLVGPDEGEGPASMRSIDEAGLRRSIQWEGPISPDRTLDRISRASIYVLPSVDEPFPMSVLEAMSLGKPVIVTGSCGLAPAIRAARAGIVVGESSRSLIEAVRTLLTDPNLRSEMGNRARDLAREAFGMDTVVRTLQDTYEEVSQQNKSMRNR
jgi:glycosyltransferase involved in cell wall biosynthesis